QPRHRQPDVRHELHLVRAGAVLPIGRGTGGSGAHLRGRDREQGRPRAVREVLPQLHAEAVGAGPVRAGCVRHRPRAGADEPRRPVLHRHVPGDAETRLHADVRAHADAPEHQDPAERRLPRGAGVHPAPRGRVHRSGRRVLRLPVRPAAVPIARVHLRNAQRGGGAAGAGGQLSERERVHARHRVQVPHRAGASEDDAGVRVRAEHRRSVLPGAEAGERRAVQDVSGARGPDRGRPLHRAARHLQVLQHGSGRRAGAAALREAVGGDTARRCRQRGMTAAAPLEIWGGVECTHNRVGDRWFDQLAWSGHDARDGDIGAFGALGLSAIRYPVLWERLAPAGIHDIDWRWTDARLAALRAHGIRPIVGLVHHGSGPRGTSLLDPAFPEQLARFAGAVARRYPWITDVTPVNEPMTTARFSALYGHWYPHARSDRSFVRALVHQLRGVVLAMDAIRQVAPAARLVQTEDCGRTFATMATRAQAAHERARQQLTWDLLTGRVDDRHPLHRFLTDAGMTSDDEAFFLNARCAPDVIGLNYYLTSDRFLDERVDRYPPSTHGGNGSIAYADVEAVRARPRGIAGHAAHLLAAWRRYGRPVAVTEVHLGGSREDQMHWIAECWRAAQCARALGADVRAITAWALLGSFNWHRLVTCDAGHYEPGVFDVRAPRPRATALAGIVSALSRGEEPAHPVLAGAPWWRRADRLTCGSLVSSRTAERRASRGSAAPPQPTRAQPLL